MKNRVFCKKRFFKSLYFHEIPEILYRWILIHIRKPGFFRFEIFGILSKIHEFNSVEKKVGILGKNYQIFGENRDNFRIFFFLSNRCEKYEIL